MSDDPKFILKVRLDKNYQDFLGQLQKKTLAEIITMAPEITAAQQLCDELAAVCDDDEVEYLLGLDNPLEVVRGYWEQEISGYDHGEEMGHMLWHLRGCGWESPAAGLASKAKQKGKNTAHER